MGIIPFRSAAIVLLLSASLTYRGQAADDDHKINKAPWKLTLTVMPRMAVAGEPVILELRARNTSDSDQTFYRWEELTLKQASPTGVTLTASKGRKQLNVEMGSTSYLAGMTVTDPVKPGGEVIARVLLSKMIDLTETGTYRVVARVRPEANDNVVLWTLARTFELHDKAERLTETEREAALKQIANLGADEWKVRDTATTKLMQYGRQIDAELEAAAKAEDPEVRYRAKLILESFSPPENTVAEVADHGGKVITMRIGGRGAITAQRAGIAATKRGDAKAAAEHFHKSVKAGNTGRLALYNAAVTLAAVGRFDDALPIMDALLEIQPDYGVVLAQRGHAHYSMGKWKKAYADYTAALDAGYHMDYSVLWIVATAYHIDDKHLASAMKRVKKIAPKMKGRNWIAPCVLMMAGNMGEKEFLAEIKSGRGATPKDRACEGYYYLGVRKLIDGDTAGAAVCFQKCLDNRVTHFMEPFLAEAELRLLKKKDEDKDDDAEDDK